MTATNLPAVVGEYQRKNLAGGLTGAINPGELYTIVWRLKSLFPPPIFNVPAFTAALDDPKRGVIQLPPYRRQGDYVAMRVRIRSAIRAGTPASTILPELSFSAGSPLRLLAVLPFDFRAPASSVENDATALAVAVQLDQAQGGATHVLQTVGGAISAATKTVGQGVANLITPTLGHPVVIALLVGGGLWAIRTYGPAVRSRS